MQWIMLLIAGSLEITWAVAMKYSEGFSKLGPSALTAVTYILSAVFLALARALQSATLTIFSGPMRTSR